MAAAPVSCLVVSCDVCKAKLEYDDHIPHYESVAEARTQIEAWFPEWMLCADGYAICDERDADHHEAIEALMPPEPVPVCDGQIEIPFAEPGVLVLTAPAEFDVYTAPVLREQVVEAVQSGAYRIVVDLSGTRVIDPTGLGVLVGQLKRTAGHGGWLRLAGAHGQVLSCLRLTALHKVFVMTDTVETAINHDSEGAN